MPLDTSNSNDIWNYEFDEANLDAIKNIKVVLSSHTIQKQVAGWCWPVGHCLLTPRLEDD